MEDIVLFFHSLHFVDIRFRWLLSSYIYRTWNRRGQKGIHCLPSKKRFRGSSWPYNFLMSVLIFLNFILHDDFDAPPPPKKRRFLDDSLKKFIDLSQNPCYFMRWSLSKKKTKFGNFWDLLWHKEIYSGAKYIHNNKIFKWRESSEQKKLHTQQLLSEANPCNFCNILCSRH